MSRKRKAKRALYQKNVWAKEGRLASAPEAPVAEQAPVEEAPAAEEAQTAEEAPEGATEKTRLGVRYSELLAFIISAI